LDQGASGDPLRSRAVSLALLPSVLFILLGRLLRRSGASLKLLFSSVMLFSVAQRRKLCTRAFLAGGAAKNGAKLPFPCAIPLPEVVFQVTGAFTEFERSITRTRVRAGLKQGACYAKGDTTKKKPTVLDGPNKRSRRLWRRLFRMHERDSGFDRVTWRSCY
jgi:hypothetical protein